MQKEVQQIKKEKAKEDAKWEITDKAQLRALEKQEKAEEKKREEAARKAENKKLYEEDMAQYKDNRQNNGKLTKAQIAQNQKKILLKSLAKNVRKYSSSSDDADTDSDQEKDQYYQPLKPNKNHILRDQQLADEEEYAEVITASGNVDNALNAMQGADKHPEKRAKAAYQKYIDDQMPNIKVEFPGLKRSQYLEIIHKNWKKAPENPFNQDYLDYNQKK